MVLSMERWQGKVAVVTGASSGIGAAIAEKLVEEGLKVVGLARRSERVQELSKKLQGKKGKLYACKADITKEEDIRNAFKWASANVGPVSILINNAGILQPTYLINGETEKWRKVLDTNVMGLCIATREAIKIMQQNKIDGHIIHINSVVGHSVPNFPGMNIYPASKHAVTALTETLRLELIALKSKIRITSLSPGFVKTEILEANNLLTEDTKAMMNTMPGLESEDLANAAVYVLSTPQRVQIHEMIIHPSGGE